MSSLRPRSLRDLLTFTRATVGSYCNADGLLVSAAVNIPRVEYDPATLAVRGFLMEEARTNYLVRSQEFDNASWTKVRSSVSANLATAPDGTLTADKLIEDTTVNDSHYVYQVYTKGSTTELQTYAASIWIKAAGRTQLRLIAQGSSGSANSADVYFDLSAITASAVTVAGAWDNAAARIEAWPNGWYRCMLDFRVNNDGQAHVVLVAMLATAVSSSYTGNGSSGVYLWGAQLEKGTGATSYVATTTAIVGRSADDCVMTSLAPWFNEQAGTVYAEYLVPWTWLASDTFSRRIVEINDGTASNRHIPVLIANGARYAIATDGGVDQVSGSLGAFAAGVVQKQAYAWAENDVSMAASGGQTATDTDVTLPTGLTSFRLGAPYIPNAYIRKVKFYPRRLSNTELAALVA